MAVLAAYMLRADPGEPLPDCLDARDRGQHRRAVAPDPGTSKGFDAFYARHRRGLAVERAAVEALD